MKKISSYPLIIKDISFFYNKKNIILHDFNTQFKPGTITAIVGMNGSGKTTFLNILAGIVDPKSGEATYNGLPLIGKELLLYKKGLGFMPESLTLYPEETVYTVLNFLAQLKELHNACDQIDYVINKTGLEEYKNQKISALSKGLKQRVNFAQSLLQQPSVAIFDEPSNGFDYLGVRMFYDTIEELKSLGSIVILTSHIFEELVNKVDKILFIQDGTIAREIILNQNDNDKDRSLIFIKLTFDTVIQEKDLIQFNAMNLMCDNADKKILKGNIVDITLIDLLNFIHKHEYTPVDIRIKQATLETTIK